MEVARIREELKAIIRRKTFVLGQLAALQAMCEHPEWDHDRDERMPSSTCTTCGVIR